MSEGKLKFYIEIAVTLDEMKDWPPERIAAFFRGLATALKARYDEGGA
jgi:hypothetical protein